MKYAVVKIAGSQYLVEEGEEVWVNKLDGKEGEKVEFPEVMLLVDEKKVQIGQPILNKIKIVGKILRHFKGEKVRVAKFKAKTGYRRVKGFRPDITSLKIEKILRGAS